MPAKRHALTVSAAVLLGAAGFFAWKTSRPGPAQELPATPAKSKSVSNQESPAPSRLEAVLDPGKPWQARIDFLRSSLRSECDESEIRDMYQMLARGPAAGELSEHWYVIANDLMEQLRLRDPDQQRFSTRLLDILDDTRQPPVLRDYAVQHLASWLNPRSSQAAPASAARPSPETAALVLDRLAAAAMDPAHSQGTIPGTTLMMLTSLVRAPGDVDCSAAIATLKPWLAEALRDGSTLATPVRVSAVQAAGVIAPDEFRPVLRGIAFSETGQSSLRLPAIAAIGQCGEAADLEELQKIIQAFPELSYAARDAHRALSSSIARADSPAPSE
jgi:hypothetical protein